MSVASTPREKWSLHWGCSSHYGEPFNMVMDPSMACTSSSATLRSYIVRLHRHNKLRLDTLLWDLL